MKVLVTENDEVESNDYEKKINLVEKFPDILFKSLNKDSILKTLDYLINEIGLNKNTSIFYRGENREVWKILLLFSFLSKNIELYYKDKRIEVSPLLSLKLNKIGVVAENLKKELSSEKLDLLPLEIKNLYYIKDGKNILSTVGEIYAKNIENFRE